MFKKLRNRFLLMHMGIVCLLVVLFFGSILLISYSSMEKSTDDRVDMLLRTRSMPQSIAIISATPMDDVLAMDAAEVTAPDQTFFAKIAWPEGPARMGLRTQMLPGIFITLDDEQAILSVESAYDMTDTFYAQITNAALAISKTTGKLRVNSDNSMIDLKYRKVDNELFFIDITHESEIITGMVSSFLLIALPLLILIFLLSLYFANHSIRPIETSYNRQKEFIGDASHELKTPLATISTNLDVLSGLADPEQTKWLGYIRSEVGRMSGLTNNLLYLTKMDYGVSPVLLPLDLGKLVEAVWLPLEAVLFERGIVAETVIAPEVIMQGDEEQIRKLVGILTDNALRYASKKINITLEKIQNQAVLLVENDGPGIPSEELDKIWERFYRCDRARCYDGGYGLGLPMAKAIAERHKGRIICESIPHERTLFTVRLPLSETRKHNA